MTYRPIRTLLIANRGEIANRIIRTARRMGIAAVAVFSDADEGAMHVASANRAMRIGPAAARESYLDIDAILGAALASGADAVHPGYGFLAENADFAQACVDHGFVFVGPPAGAIRAMGDKGQARALMAKAGAPVLPGFDQGDASAAELTSAAQAIGFPVLIKASAGGGGKGMRVVASADAFSAALDAARREAVSAVGDDRVILERFLPDARHVEVQLFADGAGRVVHLFDRDCSAQRHRQKLIEEGPAPGLSGALRERMRATAITCARAVGYVGAGTVEFLVAGDQFYFMEMNTRLQVEHPVTEAITGFDLVEWQIRVARGEPLPLDQQAIVAEGHAIEARICAEDPLQGFLPQAGRLARLRWPLQVDGVRIDAGVREGDVVSAHYDSLLAKVVAHGADRREALDRLAAALACTQIVGVGNNRSFLTRVIADADFAAGAYDTGFVERRQADFAGPHEAPSRTIVLAAAFAHLRRMEQAATPLRDPSDPFSPWRGANGWRLGGRATLEMRLVHDGNEIALTAIWRDEGYEFVVDGERSVVTGAEDGNGGLALRAGDEMLRATAILEADRFTIIVDGAEHVFGLVDQRRPAPRVEEAGGRLSSPLPGAVIAVLAEVGAIVEKGAPLVIVEAMKMEHTVCAPRAGRIETVRVSAGDAVSAGAELVVMEAAS